MMISTLLRDFLIPHLNGPVDVTVSIPGKTRIVAIRNGYVRLDLQGMRFFGSGERPGPRRTTITEKGRAALAAALASWCEALILAERSKDEVIIEALSRSRESAQAQGTKDPEKAISEA